MQLNQSQLNKSQILAKNTNFAMSVSDVSNDKITKLHNILYKKAIAGLKDANADLFDGAYCYIITELPNSDGILLAPKVSVIIYSDKSNFSSNFSSKNNNITTYTFSLEKWWENTISDNVDIQIERSREKKDYKGDARNGKFKDVKDWSNCECTYINYINSTVTIKNKIFGWERKIPYKIFMALNSECDKSTPVIPLSEAMQKVNSNDMFYYQYKNKKLGMNLV